MEKLYALVKTEHVTHSDPETKVMEIGSKDKCLKRLSELAKTEPFENFDPKDPETWNYVQEGDCNYETFTGYVIDTP